MRAKISFLRQTDYWEEIHRPETDPLLHTEFVKKSKRNRIRNIEKYNKILILCGNEEGDVK